MSKYEKLWEHLQIDGGPVLRLTFEEIKAILGFEIDHSFLTYKKEAGQFGYHVGKISLKEKHVTFNKIETHSMGKYLQCQSCGMTFDKQHKKFIAKEKDGSDSIYCTYCYKDGEFIAPNATMEDMIEIAVPHFTSKTGDEKTARAYMTKVVSGLSRWATDKKVYEFNAVIQSSDIGKGGTYVSFPYDVREEFGKGRVQVRATFDGEPYDGSIVNMGVKNPDGSVCYIIGVLKDIRTKIGKQPGDMVRITVKERL